MINILSKPDVLTTKIIYDKSLNVCLMSYPLSYGVILLVGL